MTLTARSVLLWGMLLGSFALFVYPYLPKIFYQASAADQVSTPAVDLSIPYIPGLADISSDDAKITEEYQLVIPKIEVNTAILESSSIAILDQQEGVWHEPNTGNPTEEGNMVIAGHRFQYLPPNKTTFYHLDKLKEGDEIFVRWGTEEYRYVVKKSFVVKPQQVEIRNATPGLKELTLYTCTPIGSNARRLVVKAELQQPALPTIYSAK